MKQFVLQLLQPLLRSPPFGDVANKAREQPSCAARDLADRQFHGKSTAIAPLAHHDAPLTNDPLFAGIPIMRQVTVMLFAIRRRHQCFYILAGHLR